MDSYVLLCYATMKLAKGMDTSNLLIDDTQLLYTHMNSNTCTADDRILWIKDAIHA